MNWTGILKIQFNIHVPVFLAKKAVTPNNTTAMSPQAKLLIFFFATKIIHKALVILAKKEIRVSLTLALSG
jgi:hypothetical protein